MLAWVAPRGIVAAAVAALFALQLQQQGVEQAAMLVPMTFMGQFFIFKQAEVDPKS